MTWHWLLIKICFWLLGFKANMCFHRDAGDLDLVQVPTCISNSIMLCSFKMWWCKLKSLKYAHPQRSLKKGKVASVMWSREEVQKNPTLCKQAIINSPPADHRRICFPYSIPSPTEKIPNLKSQRDLDHRSLQCFTPQSTKNPVTNSPNVEKEITSFPFLSPISPTSYE